MSWRCALGLLSGGAGLLELGVLLVDRELERGSVRSGHLAGDGGLEDLGTDRGTGTDEKVSGGQRGALLALRPAAREAIAQGARTVRC